MALMQRAEHLEHPADWLILAKNNRNLGNKEKLWDKITKQKPGKSIHSRAKPLWFGGS